jgi:hypothetical protein
LIPFGVPLLRHEGAVVQGSQSAIPRPPEHDFGHPRSLILTVFSTGTDRREHVTQNVLKRFSKAVSLRESK